MQFTRRLVTRTTESGRASGPRSKTLCHNRDCQKWGHHNGAECSHRAAESRCRNPPAPGLQREGDAGFISRPPQISNGGRGDGGKGQQSHRGQPESRGGVSTGGMGPPCTHLPVCCLVAKPPIQCLLKFPKQTVPRRRWANGTDRNAHCSAARCLRVSGEHQPRADRREQHYAGAACASDPVNVSEQFGSDDDYTCCAHLQKVRKRAGGGSQGVCCATLTWTKLNAEAYSTDSICYRL